MFILIFLYKIILILTYNQKYVDISDVKMVHAQKKMEHLFLVACDSKKLWVSANKKCLVGIPTNQ